MGVSGQHHAQPRFTPGERTTGTHWTGGWVGPRAGTQKLEEKSSVSVGYRNPGGQSVVKHSTD
jgi:hypothetical protein